MEKIKDLKTGKDEIVKDKTSNSYLISQTKLTDKGINCDNWYEEIYFTVGNKKYRFQKHK